MTAQLPDRIQFKINGPCFRLCINPLTHYLRREGLGKGPGELISSANRRGYVATWLIHQDRFWLSEVRGDGRLIARRVLDGEDGYQARAAVIDPQQRPFTVDGLFPDPERAAGDPVFADWFSGELRIPEGKQLKYVHGGYGSTYERDRLIQIERGRVLRCWVRTNDPPEPRNSIWNQHPDEDESGGPEPRDGGDPPEPEA